MWYHIAIVFAATFLLTFLWELTVVISITHWAIDSVNVHYSKKTKSEFGLFSLD